MRASVRVPYVSGGDQVTMKRGNGATHAEYEGAIAKDDIWIVIAAGIIITNRRVLDSRTFIAIAIANTRHVLGQTQMKAEWAAQRYQPVLWKQGY